MDLHISSKIHTIDKDKYDNQPKRTPTLIRDGQGQHNEEDFRASETGTEVKADEHTDNELDNSKENDMEQDFQALKKRLVGCKKPGRAERRKRRTSVHMSNLRPQQLEVLEKIEFPHGIRGGMRVIVEACVLNSNPKKELALRTADAKGTGGDEIIPIYLEQSAQRDGSFVSINMEIEFEKKEVKTKVNGEHQRKVPLKGDKSKSCSLYPGDGVEIHSYKIKYMNVAHFLTDRCLEWARRTNISKGEEQRSIPKNENWELILEEFNEKLQHHRWKSVRESDIQQILDKVTEEDLINGLKSKSAPMTTDNNISDDMNSNNASACKKPEINKGQTSKRFLMTQLIFWDTLMGINQISDDVVGHILWNDFCSTVKEKGNFFKIGRDDGEANEMITDQWKVSNSMERLDLDLKEQREQLYFAVEATCFFSIKARKSLTHAERYICMKNECLVQIAYLLEATQSLDFVLGLDKGENPVGDKRIQPLALALHFQMGDILSFPKVQHVMAKLWFDELFDTYYSMMCDTEWLHEYFVFPPPSNIIYGRCGVKIHSSLYRKVPILFAYTELIFWFIVLGITYWILWRDNHEGVHWDQALGDHHFDKRHIVLILLGLGFLCQELCEIKQNTFHDYWANSLSNVVDVGTWLIFCVWVYYKLFRGHDKNAYWVLSINSIFMLFRLLRYFEVAQKNDTLVPSLLEMIKDVVRFLRLYFLFLWGFSFVIYCIFWETEQFASIYGTLLALFSSTLGTFEFEWFQDHPARHLGEILLCLFLIINMILLFNMLIAILTKTYDKASEGAKHRWSLVNAQFLKDCQMAHDNEDYQIVTTNLPPPFTLVSVLFAGRLCCIEGYICYAIDICCTVLLFLAPCLILDLSVYLLQLELQALSLISSVLPNMREWRREKKWQGCYRACLYWCGKVLGVLTFQAVSVPLLVAVYLIAYPFYFLCNASSVHVSAKGCYFSNHKRPPCPYGSKAIGISNPNEVHPLPTK